MSSIYSGYRTTHERICITIYWQNLFEARFFSNKFSKIYLIFSIYESTEYFEKLKVDKFFEDTIGKSS